MPTPREWDPLSLGLVNCPPSLHGACQIGTRVMPPAGSPQWNWVVANNLTPLYHGAAAHGPKPTILNPAALVGGTPPQQPTPPTAGRSNGAPPTRPWPVLPKPPSLPSPPSKPPPGGGPIRL